MEHPNSVIPTIRSNGCYSQTATKHNMSEGSFCVISQKMRLCRVMLMEEVKVRAARAPYSQYAKSQSSLFQQVSVVVVFLPVLSEKKLLQDALVWNKGGRCGRLLASTTRGAITKSEVVLFTCSVLLAVSLFADIWIVRIQPGKERLLSAACRQSPGLSQH